MDNGFTVPGASDRKAFLFEKGVDSARLAAVIREAMEERKKGVQVLVAQMNWNGMLEGAVYGFVEDPEEGWSPIECRLELLKISDETYTDAGHAIEWCIKNAH